MGIVSPLLAGAVSGTGSLLNSAILSPYSRGQENDADAIGQKLAAKAGWDPRGITFFLNTLDREAERNGNKNRGIAFLSTHPPTPDRVRNTQLRADEIDYKQSKSIADSQATFLAKLDGLIVGADARQGVVINQHFLHPIMHIGMTFPAEWEIVNQADYVVAISKKQDASLILQLQREGNNAEAAARSFMNEVNLGNLAVQKLTISGLPASQIMFDKRGQKAVITWIAFAGDIYRLIGISKSSKANYNEVLRQSIFTFHQLSLQEKTLIRQQRIRIVSTKDGENMTELLKRAGSHWDEETCAIANNLQIGAPLKKGQLVKVVISEVFQ